MNRPFNIDDNPEWTDEDFARARPASEVVGQALTVDEIGERLRTASPNGRARHIVIEPPPSRREVRYAVAGACAALIAGIVLAGVVA